MSLGLLCPGQGDQHPDMFAGLENSPCVGAILDHCAQAIGVDPLRVPVDLIRRNAVAQPLVCALQLATWKALSEHLPAPRAVAGYSVGELAAYGCAGALTATDVIDLAVHRSRLMDATCTGPCGMAAVRGLSRQELQALCAFHGAEIAIVNDVDRLVIGAPHPALEACLLAAAGDGAKVTPLEITVASHTSMMRAAVAPFRANLAAADWRQPKFTVISGVRGTPVHGKDRAVEALALQIATTINWACCLDGMAEMGCTVLLELGPGSRLSRMAQDRLPHIPARAVCDFHSLHGAIEWVERRLHTSR